MTDRMFGVFDPAMDEDVLVPLGAIDRLLPDQTKIKCDCLRSVIELVYKNPKYCHWEHLGTAICKFAAYNLSKNNLVKYTGFEVKYGIEYNLLLEASSSCIGGPSSASSSRILQKERVRSVYSRL
jgi:hypothetical protein